MIKSMTGFGKSIIETKTGKTTIEIKTLNSKQSDINCRIPSTYKIYEVEIRKLLMNNLERGKIDCTFSTEQNPDQISSVLNVPIAKLYFDELKTLSETLGIDNKIDYLSNLLKMPDVFSLPTADIDPNEWILIKNGILNTINSVNDFRLSEGRTLEIDLRQRKDNILKLLLQIPPFEEQRIKKIKERIKLNLENTKEIGQVDQNRFEQEMIYFLEKLDITEEKIRLQKHLDYFNETLSLDLSSGKKLGFISQEIGREINTLGSKANDADIQKIVVLMKDELEKIKEQLFNIL